MSNFERLCKSVSQTFNGVSLEPEKKEKLIVLPFDYPIPLKDDWTVKVSSGSLAESEVRKLHSIKEGILFTRISLKKAEKIFLDSVLPMNAKECNESKSVNAKKSLKKSLNNLKELKQNGENADAIKNLFFSTKTNKFYQIVTFTENEDKSKYDFKLALLARAKIIKSALDCFNVGDRIVFLVKCSDKTEKKVNDMKEDFDLLGISLHTTKEENFYLPQDEVQSNVHDQFHGEIEELVQFLVKACKDEYFCTLQNPKIQVPNDDPTVTESKEMSLVEYLDSKIDCGFDGELKMIPEKEELFWEIPLRESKEEGISPTESFTKVEGEIINFYEELIDPVRSKMNGTLVYSMGWDMLKEFISFPQGKRKEMDWVYFSRTEMIVFEASAAQQHKKQDRGPEIRKLTQVFGKIMPLVNNLLHCIARQFRDNATFADTLKDLNNFRNKCLKFVIYDKKISKKQWDKFFPRTPVNQFLSNEDIRGLKSSLLLDYVYIAASDGKCSDSKAEIPLYQIKLRETSQDWEKVSGKLIKCNYATLQDLLLDKGEAGISDTSLNMLQRLKKVTALAAYKFYSEKFSKQQRSLINDTENLFKLIIGEAGVGKTHTCIAIVKKYLVDLQFYKILYLIPKHKVAFGEFVKQKMLEEFDINPDSEKKIVFGDVKTSVLQQFLDDNRRFGRRLGLIIEECTVSKEQTIETDNGDISELFPFLDMICITLSIGGQMECVQGSYNNSRPLGFRRYVLNVGYRSSSEILRFSSTVLHEATCKQICGTSVVYFPPRMPNEPDIQIEKITGSQLLPSMKEWLRTYEVNERCVIVFRVRPLDEFKQDQAVFQHSPTEQFKNLTFSGFEQDHVLIVIDTVFEAKEQEKWPSENFSLIFLNAATRAKKSLKFIITNDMLVTNLENLKKRRALVVALDNERKPNLSNCEDLIRLGVHREDINLLKGAFDFRYKNRKKDDKKIEIFIDFVLPGCAGREKSKHFLKLLSEFLRKIDPNRELNRTDYGQMKKWFVATYSRGLLRVVDWRMEENKGIPQGPVEDFQSLITQVLSEAVRNGSLKIVQHAFGEGLKFFSKIRKIEELEIQSEIVTKKHTLTGREEQQSLLSLAARTNKDPEVVRFLLKKLPLSESATNSRIRCAIEQAMRWSIKYEAFQMLQAMTEINDEMEKIFLQLLNEDPVSKTQFKEKLDRYRIEIRQQLQISDQQCTNNLTSEK